MNALAFLVRSLAIVGVAAAAGARYGLTLLSSPVLTRDAERRWKWRLRGRILQSALARLGATFIKLGQVMSTRPDLFEPDFIDELKRLQDRLPAFSGAAARAQIEATVGQRIDAVFSEFETEPVAAASVAQVHRGVLIDGHEVAVKVLRPDVREKTERDAIILMALARLAMRLHPHAEHANLAGHLTHFIDGVLAQTDLRIEAEHYVRFRENFADVEGIRFPGVVDALSGERVMTMDFIRGRKVDALSEGEHPVIASRLRRAFLQMLFRDGFLHADLHPGNLLIEEDGGIAIFDVGLSKSLDGELLEEYIDFNRCLVMGSTMDFVRHIRRYHSYAEGSVAWDSLEEDIEVFIAGFRGKPASELEFGNLIERVFAVGRKHGVRPVPDMTLTMVGLVTAEGMGKQLDPSSDSFGEVAAYLMPILLERGMMPS